MGMVVDGRWTDDEKLIVNGRYARQESVFADRIDDQVLVALRDDPNRFLLIASASCQWSHRTLLVRALKGLSALLPVHLAHGPRFQGYAINGGRIWRVPGSNLNVMHLHELYTKADPSYTGRSTVPVLWDAEMQAIVSNDSSVISKAFDRMRTNSKRPSFVLHPGPFDGDLHGEIDQLQAKIYDGLSNGVYRAGFAESQSAYDKAVADVFATLDFLERRLSQQRYLMGAATTLTDWYLFPTLVRFDAVYHVLHRCCRRRLIDYPNLWAYARDLYSWKGVAQTVDFDELRSASYRNDTAVNPHGIVAIAPDADWDVAHGRDRFGPARIFLSDGASMAVDPATFDPQSGD